MNKKVLMLMAIVMVVSTLSCGKKADETASAGDSFYYLTLADAKNAAELDNQLIVLDFYFDE